MNFELICMDILLTTVHIDVATPCLIKESAEIMSYRVQGALFSECCPFLYVRRARLKVL